MLKVPTYAKAIVAAVIAVAGALGTALEDGSLTVPEIVTAVLALLAGGGATWAVPNKPASAPPTIVE